MKISKNEQNKRTAETLIINAASDVKKVTYPVLFMLFLLLFSFLCCCWIGFFHKRQTKMKLKFSAKSKEPNICINADRKYAIRGFNLHLPYAVYNHVSSVLFFVLFVWWLFENRRDTKIKMKESREPTKQKNGGIPDSKYYTRRWNGNCPLLFLLLFFSFLCFWCRDCLNKISISKFLTQN